MSMDEIENLVRELERNLELAKRRGERIAKEQILETIGPDLGHVVVAGNGSLLDIELDSDAVFYTNEIALAAHIRQAIIAAEARADALRSHRPQNGNPDR